MIIYTKENFVPERKLYHIATEQSEVISHLNRVKIYRFYEVKISSKLLVWISTKLFASKPYVSQYGCRMLSKGEIYNELFVSE